MITIKISGKWEIVCKVEDFVWIALILEKSQMVTENEVWEAGGKVGKHKSGYIGFSKWIQ